MIFGRERRKQARLEQQARPAQSHEDRELRQRVRIADFDPFCSLIGQGWLRRFGSITRLLSNLTSFTIDRALEKLQQPIVD